MGYGTNKICLLPIGGNGCKTGHFCHNAVSKSKEITKLCFPCKDLTIRRGPDEPSSEPAIVKFATKCNTQ